ncbi:hypothetical protein BT93_L4534 [Corymbia citriodora subsp. variegata]|uniref:rRNA methyltransferase 2, mitochondrial n=1 Tax=Corymbia citriodora subsp. variegata TaxID=360336 RepID=A0A8T0CJQ3_CORYI|nr:hypothetical protein BT93_L4534 [Corymbia citriodora subsp. variegata]
MTVVDLGFAPGSWSQVAIDLVRPGLGRVVGVDIIPVAPPKGVNALQGDFLSRDTQERVRELLKDENAGRVHRHELIKEENNTDPSYLDQDLSKLDLNMTGKAHRDKCIDVILSDMSAPWELASGYHHRSISNPYHRLMNTSGNKFKDHAGSMDLCRSALYFAFDTLRVGGNFVCKFYQGAEDKQFEKQLKSLFSKVHRDKPESSRSESKEAFFIGIQRLSSAEQDRVFDEGG